MVGCFSQLSRDLGNLFVCPCAKIYLWNPEIERQTVTELSPY